MTSLRPSSGAPFVDAVSLWGGPAKDPIRVALDDLLTRAFYSAAGYVFESDPYAVPEDDDLFRLLSSVRLDDRRHSHVLGGLIQARGGVPQPAVFPFWNLDLNYLSVPYLCGFVCETIEREIADYGRLIEAWPTDDAGGRVALEAIRNDKRAHLERLRPAAEAARAREAATYADRIAARKKARVARLAKEKAAAEAAKKAKAAARPGAVTAPAAAAVVARPAVAAAPAATGGDPNEPGITPKERARRQMAKMRGAAGAAPAATPGPAPAAAPAMGDLGDPDEPGISPKEKARRKMARMRAAGGGPPAAAPAAPAAAAAAPAPAAVVGDLGDPDEPGISPKEKARRKMARMRAAAGGGAPAAAAVVPAAAAVPVAAPAPMAEDVGDPDEPGISPKEKARRQVARMRAQRKT